MSKTQSLAFTGLLCAIHIMVIFLSEYVPFFDLFFIFFLPIFSALLTIKCDLKYSFLLFVSTMLIGLIINPVSAILSLFTPLIYGILYGYLIKKNVKSTTIIYLLTTCVTLLFSFDVFIITKFLNEDFISILCNFFHLDSFYNNKQVLFLLIVFSFSQAFVTHFILKFTLKKLKIKVKNNEFPPLFLLLFILISLLCAIFIKKEVYKHLCYWLTLIFSIPYIIYSFNNSKYIVITLISCVITFLCLTIPLLNVVKESYKYLLFLLIFVPPLLVGIFREFKENKIKKLLTTI